MVGNASLHAPYRIENRCKDVRVLFKQKDVWGEGAHRGYDLLPPQQV